MPSWLNQHLNKISFDSVLRAPPESGTGNGAGTQSNDNGDGNGDSQENGDGGDDEDGDLAEGLGLSDEDDDADDFEFGDDSSEYVQTAEDIEAGKALGESIKTSLADYSIDDKAIPDDFDPNDRESLKSLLSNTQRSAIASTIQMMVPIINHALGTASKQMKHHMDSSATGNATKSKAVQAFQGLGLTDKNQVILGKSLFQQAMRANKNDVSKATRATRQALKTMGINVASGGNGNGNGSGRNQNRNQHSSGVKEGASALDDIFGKMAANK